MRMIRMITMIIMIIVITKNTPSGLSVIYLSWSCLTELRSQLVDLTTGWLRRAYETHKLTRCRTVQCVLRRFFRCPVCFGGEGWTGGYLKQMAIPQVDLCRRTLGVGAATLWGELLIRAKAFLIWFSNSSCGACKALHDTVFHHLGTFLLSLLWNFLLIANPPAYKQFPSRNIRDDGPK